MYGQLAPQLAVRLDDLLQVPCGAFTVEFMDIADLDHEVRAPADVELVHHRTARDDGRIGERVEIGRAVMLGRVGYPVERGHRSGPAVRQLDPHLVGATAGIRERHERCRAVQHGEVFVHRVGGDRPFDAVQAVGHDDRGSAARLDTPAVPSRGRDTHRRAAVRACRDRAHASRVVLDPIETRRPGGHHHFDRGPPVGRKGGVDLRHVCGGLEANRVSDRLKGRAVARLLCGVSDGGRKTIAVVVQIFRCTLISVFRGQYNRRAGATARPF